MAAIINCTHFELRMLRLLVKPRSGAMAIETI
jgi:hypothetical protein